MTRARCRLALCLKANSSEDRPRILVPCLTFVLLRRTTALGHRMYVRLSLKMNFR